jgi:hypothetical protein
MSPTARERTGQQERTILRESLVSVRRRGLGSGPVCTVRLTDRFLLIRVPLTRLRLGIPLSDITRVVIDNSATLVRLHVWYIRDADGGGIRLLVKNPRRWVEAFLTVGIDVAGDPQVAAGWNRVVGLGYSGIGVAVIAGLLTAIVLSIRHLALAR